MEHDHQSTTLVSGLQAPPEQPGQPALAPAATSAHDRMRARNAHTPDQPVAPRAPEDYAVPALEQRRKNDKYLMDGNKMPWHLDRVEAWRRGERIAPVHIDQGLSKGCNIQCHYCYGVTQGNFYRQGAERVFPREPLLDYMRSAGKIGVRSIAFIGEGEPTLNPALYEAVVLGKQCGVDISVATNGVLWRTDRDGQAALEHLSWIRFNLSAASEASYRVIHASKEFNRVLGNIRLCVEHKHRHNLGVTIGLQMVLTPKDANEVVPLAKLGREIGVDYLQIKHCSDTVENDLGFFKRLDEYEQYVPLLKEAESCSNQDYRVIAKWDKITNHGHRRYDQCLGAPFLLYGEGTGRMYTCGMFFDGKYEKDYRLGDLKTQSLEEIVLSDHYWQVVAKVRDQINVHKECYANCRTHSCNNFLWDAKLAGGVTAAVRANHAGGYASGAPPPHVNFI
ncbi:MAG: radical SAM/SPASM domain-containing protein [Verrucomicrobiota bacterium]|jgi:MoaA/NifB/PqqE/SkfB family radical SAM enzyme